MMDTVGASDAAKLLRDMPQSRGGAQEELSVP